MTSRWHQKKEKQRLEQLAREEAAIPEYSLLVKDQASAAAMGDGEEELFEKKLSKEEKKARAKAAREAKKKAKGKNKKGSQGDGDETKEDIAAAAAAALEKVGIDSGDTNGSNTKAIESGIDPVASDKLASEGTICTFATSRKGVDSRSRDINVSNFTLQHMGGVLLDETEIILNHGNRYGLVGRNGCGKSTLLKALGVRAVPIPSGIDIFHLSEEIEPSDKITAFEAVMAVDEERNRLEQQAEELNDLLGKITDLQAEGEEPTGEDGEEVKTFEEQQEEIMEALNVVYERLDALDASTAEVRARSILKGLGFTHEMQGKLTKDFSGGWRMRVSLARALFIQPICLLLDEPTNHLDMEAVIWLEEYLSTWDKILLLVSHSQDFLNNVCTHMIHFTNKRKLVYYDGNYDQFIKTKSEKEENQMKQYKWEQDQIKSMKEYIARFGHGTSKNAKQAQSKEKVLAKMIRGGLTEKPEEEKLLNFKFPDPGHLPPPVLAFHDVSFGYPGCEPLYTNINFGVDLDSRIALVGPNGAGKTTLVKLMSGELTPSLGDIRPHGHLKLGRFTQHFVDVLDVTMTPLEFFEKTYPNDPHEEQRKYLGRFGVSGKMQVQKMEELSDGQKSRVVFAKLGRDVPHILLLDEPTNHLDMESIDALAKAVNEFEGGLVLVSHDMRLISQVAKEIWICDHKTVKPYKGDILKFKMNMREQMGIDNDGQKAQSQAKSLRGDASVAVTEATKKQKKKQEEEKKLKQIEKEKKEASISVVLPPSKPTPPPISPKGETEEEAPDNRGKDTSRGEDPPATKKYVPLHLRNKDASGTSSGSSASSGRYVPPHLRK